MEAPTPAEVLRKLRWHAQHDPVYMKGVSEAAFAQIREFLYKAESSTDRWFERPPRGNAVARRNLRYLAALVPLDPYSNLSEAVFHIVGNTNLSIQMVDDILNDPNEYPGRMIQLAGHLLRDGDPQREVAKVTGMQLRKVNEIARFLGTAEALEEALWEQAVRFTERGETNAAAFSAETGVGLRKAKELLASVRAGLAGRWVEW